MSIDVGHKRKIKTIWKEWKTTIFVILTILIIRSSFFNWYTIPSSSMNPNLIEGDLVTVNMLAYDLHLPFTNIDLHTFNNPERGDIVATFVNNEGNDKRYVKRIIGKPNDRVKMVNNLLYVNDKEFTKTSVELDLSGLPSSREGFSFDSFTEKQGDLSYSVIYATSKEGYNMEQYLKDNIISNFNEITVPEGKYFIMGDNRNLSKDSRFIGFSDREDIIGKITGVTFNYTSIYTNTPSRLLFDIYK
jgi:signal peptidase I